MTVRELRDISVPEELRTANARGAALRAAIAAEIAALRSDLKSIMTRCHALERVLEQDDDGWQYELKRVNRPSHE